MSEGHCLPNRMTAYGPVAEISAVVQIPDLFAAKTCKLMNVRFLTTIGYGGYYSDALL